MNKWRADQNPSLTPGEAILVLLRRSLALQGYLDDVAAGNAADNTDALAQAFRNFIESKTEAQGSFD